MSYQFLAINSVLMLVLFVMGYRTFDILGRARELGIEQTAIHEQIAEESARKLKLEADKLELATEQVAEREAKERFNLKKPGETVVVVVPEEEQTKRPPALATTSSPWKRLKNVFR